MAKDKKISKLVKRLTTRYLNASSGLTLYSGRYDFETGKVLDRLDLRNLDPLETGQKLIEMYKCAVMLNEIFSLYDVEETGRSTEMRTKLREQFDECISFIEGIIGNSIKYTLEMKLKGK